MIYYKIYLINNFETDKEISNRPLARGYNKAHAPQLITKYPVVEGNTELNVEYPAIIVFIDNDMLLHEFYTGNFLRMYNITGKENDSSILTFNDLSHFSFDLIPEEELPKYKELRKNLDLRKVIAKVIFNQDNDFEVSTMEELAEDRAIQHDAYNNNLTTVNPYSFEFIKRDSLRFKR
ncbi:MAG: hypothetical protein J6X02_04125 [Bacilli bacterium]|nr:hypothetical protein [Bacilli bacterium]